MLAQQAGGRASIRSKIPDFYLSQQLLNNFNINANL
jgi:hypothetical protein